MKKFLKVLLVVVMIFGLTGCVKYNVNMGINDDESVTLEVVYGVNSSLMSSFDGDDDSDQSQAQDDSFQKLLESSGGNLSISGSYSEDDGDLKYTPPTSDDDWTWSTDDDDNDDDQQDDYTEITPENFSFLEKKGYKVETYSENTDNGMITGVKITKTFKSIDDITKNSKKIVDMVNMFDAENANNFDDSQFFYKNGDNYKASFKFDFSEEEGSEDFDYSAYESYFDLKYKVTLPTKAVSSNATSTSDDGKTLTWNLSYAKTNNVEFEFNFNQKTDTLVYALIGVGAIAVVVIVVLAVTKSKKTPKNNNFSGNHTSSQTIPVQPTPTPVPTPMPTPEPVQQPEQVQQTTHNFCANCGQRTVNGICPNCSK